MPTRKRTISVRMDPAAARQLEAAAQLTNQSRGAFLERAGAEAARRVLVENVVTRYRKGEASLSELAAETGLAVEEIVDAMSVNGEKDSLDHFLASCRTVAESFNDPEFLVLAEQAVEVVRKQDHSEAA